MLYSMNRLFLFFFSLLLSTALHAARIDTVNVYSKAMNKQVSTVVIVPTEGSPKKYPVVFLLHGAYANQFSWLGIKPELPAIADREGLVFVMPYALNTWYFDSPLNADVKYETFISKELVQYVDSCYPVLKGREHHAITGYSMGGHGALFCALRHKDVFGAVGSMSGGVDFRPFPQNWNIKDQIGEMAANKERWDSLVVVGQINRIENGELAIIFDCGEQDFFLEVNKDLHKRLLGRGIGHDFIIRPGGHTSQYWGNSFDYHLLFFQKFFNRKK